MKVEYLKKRPAFLIKDVDCVIAIYDVARMLDRNGFDEIADELRLIADKLSLKMKETRGVY
jgi:hypothetical protein